jgi:hypothetical protein
VYIRELRPATWLQVTEAQGGFAGQMIRVLVTASLLAFLGLSAAAQTATKHTEVTEGLAMVLASEHVCGLSYDQRAVQTFVERNVSPDNLDFAIVLNLLSVDFARQIAGMTQSQRTAHCAQTRQVARRYKFISDSPARSKDGRVD